MYIHRFKIEQSIDGPSYLICQNLVTVGYCADYEQGHQWIASLDFHFIYWDSIGFKKAHTVIQYIRVLRGFSFVENSCAEDSRGPVSSDLDMLRDIRTYILIGVEPYDAERESQWSSSSWVIMKGRTLLFQGEARLASRIWPVMSMDWIWIIHWISGYPTPKFFFVQNQIQRKWEDHCYATNLI